MALDPKRIWSSSQLPTLPTVAIRLLELSRNPESEIRDVIQALQSDPAIAAKILKAANSTYFGLKAEVKAVDRAVPMLGTTVTTSLALSFSLADDAMSAGAIAEHYQQYWMQSIVQAAAAELVGQRLDPAAASEFFLVGLLQDLGRLAMLKVIAREYLPILEAAKVETAKTLSILESESLGFDHVEIGARLMEHWKLPAVMSQAIQLHHATPESVFEQRESPGFSLVLGAAVAGSIGEYFCSSHKGLALERLRRLTRDGLNLTEADLETFLKLCNDRITQAADLFNVDVTSLGDPGDLMVQANEQLVSLTLREHASNTQAVERQRTVEREKEELETRNRELQKQALHDPLTKVYNRNFFDEALGKEANRCQRAASPIGVIFADIDHFKKLNDGYGHQFGDLVLQQVANVFQNTIRNSDVLARYGGEEFVILVSQPTEKGIEKLAERVREAIANEPFQFGENRVSVTCSLGAAVSVPRRTDVDVGKKIVAAADECLYEAKRSGRNRVVLRSLLDPVEQELMNRVTQNRFSRWLVAQQILDIKSVSQALLECQPQQLRFGELSAQRGYLTSEQIEQVVEEQERTGERFGVAAVRLKLLTEEQVVHVLTLQQENPKQLTATLIRLGMLPPDQVAAALERYLALQPKPRTRELANA